ncbi:hypothetical protein C723_3141 [Christiangramia flava JLT2011]|uniref:Uncharacterized protein n=1 Tax=Christiangramia flava JLT2011 TaxID=1229726 RepID=A0A1L7I8I0_9FLAO|nr:hypothetical protein GRFL_2810 [Christiangramia flava JLT2011]OSS37862.1 hypothetical protein C723_3141 [Christiangramia flava JLT2011]
MTNKPIENGTMLMEFEAIFSGRLHISSDLTKKDKYCRSFIVIGV